jgi:hypothetical protein
MLRQFGQSSTPINRCGHLGLFRLSQHEKLFSQPEITFPCLMADYRLQENPRPEFAGGVGAG